VEIVINRHNLHKAELPLCSVEPDLPPDIVALSASLFFSISFYFSRSMSFCFFTRFYAISDHHFDLPSAGLGQGCNRSERGRNNIRRKGNGDTVAFSKIDLQKN